MTGEAVRGLAAGPADAAAESWFGGRAALRPVSPDSLTWASLLLACCAAAWFSGGTPAGNLLGTAALGGWLLAAQAARGVGNEPALMAAERRRAARTRNARSTDWLVLPGPGWGDDIPMPAGRRAAPDRGSAGSPRLHPGPPRRLPRQPGPGDVPGAGGAPGTDGPAGGRSTPGSGGSGGSGGTARKAGPSGRAARAPASVAARAACLRAAGPAVAECAVYGGIAAGGQAAGWDTMWQLATMAVIATALRQAITVCSGQAPVARRSWRRRFVLAAMNPPVTARLLIVVAGLLLHGPRVAIFCVLAVETLSLLVALIRLRRLSARTAVRSGPARTAVVLAARDDGTLVRWAGRLVRGNLVPLAPAIAGLTATALLAMLGMGNLHGIIALTPPVVMLLAAPGASHPHDGRYDWLVPVILQAAQYLYLATLGFAWRVPGPMIYALCALTAVWYAALAASASGRRSGIGWEARMFIAGLSAIVGLASFAYLALAAYLGVLISRKVMTGTLSPVEDTRR